MKISLPYLACSTSKVRPEPAPTTWMIDAHSAFLSMSDTEDFCTLRILPRIGSSAWNSELRASLAVPSAESPSTMNSSLRSTSSLRQSASLAESAEVSRAFLRRCASLCWRAAIRVRAADTIFSMTARACARSARLVLDRNTLSSLEITWATMRVGAALGRGDDVDERAGHGVVPGTPAQRDVHGELALHLGRGHVALAVEHRH